MSAGERLDIDGPALSVLPAADWAGVVADALAARIARQPGLVACLPTGSTPLPVYDRLPGALARHGTTLERARVVQLDEYLDLPPGHPARCETKLRTHLLDRLARPPARIVRFDVDDGDPAETCATFEAQLRALGGLDLVVLGLGANGHVGMNEPGTPATGRTRVVELSPSTIQAARRYGADPPPTRGLTLGLADILEAGEIWLLVTGAPKAAILAAAIDGAVSADIPASLLRGHPGLRVLADDAAWTGRQALATL